MRLCVFLGIALVTLGLAAAASAQAQAAPARQAPPVENTMAQRMLACVACHGKEGRATNTGYFPRIAGKPAGYVYNQLQNFKARRRSNETMGHLLQHMSDAYLLDIALYFSQLDLPYPPARAHELSPAQQQVAENLVFNGAPQRQLPACVACHGQQMAGQLPATPGLLTLPADYLIAQLGGWRTGQRRAMAPDCMAEIAKRLTPEEIGAVSRWLSAQTLPSGTRPAAASAGALPMPCGGGAR
jgi:cytochrome c553